MGVDKELREAEQRVNRAHHIAIAAVVVNVVAVLYHAWRVFF